jgi:hypothetical protein
MIAQYTAASLVSENKVLCHPASVDSIPTSANIEDHVAMATHAARKLRQVIENTSAVLAIELLVAAQAVEWRTTCLDPECKPFDDQNYYGISPNTPGSGDRKLPDVDTNPAKENNRVAARARNRNAAFSAMFKEPPLLSSERTARGLGVGTREIYAAVRHAVGPVKHDCVLAPLIRAVRVQVRDHTIAAAAAGFVIDIKPLTHA